MGINKKGFFFTFIAIVILSIFLIIFSWDPTESPNATLYSEEAKINVINDFTKDLKDVYLTRALYITSKKALFVMNEYTSVNKKPITDVDSAVEDLLLYGYLEGAPVPMMENITLINWSDKIVELSYENFRINTNVTFGGVRVYQVDPWTVNFAVDVNIITNYSDIIYSMGGEVLTNISISELSDPLFSMHGFNRTILKGGVTAGNWSSLIGHVGNGSYIFTELSPSYLMRFENNTLSSSCCGIESLLNSSFGNYNYSYVDYLFFNQTYVCGKATPYGKLYNMTYVWNSTIGNYFKIDGPHLNPYGFNYDGLNVTILCS